jgi:CheY-like chemotaxis protein
MSRRTKGSGNLLIVDDHATNLKLLRAQLEAEGHAAFEAHDGVEALALLERLHRGGIRAGSRASRKHAANCARIPVARSTSRSNTAPPSDVSAPPSKRACTVRRATD